MVAGFAVAWALLGAGHGPGTVRANPASIYVINTNVGAWRANLPPAAYVAWLTGPAYSRAQLLPDIAAASTASGGQISSDMAHAGDDWIVVRTDGALAPISLNGRGLACTPACDGVATQTPDPGDFIAVWHVTGLGTFTGGPVTALQSSVSLDSAALRQVGPAHDMQFGVVGNKTTVQAGGAPCYYAAPLSQPPYARVRVVYTDINTNALVGYLPTLSTSAMSILAVGGPGAAAVASQNVVTMVQPDATTSGQDVVCGIGVGVATLSATSAAGEITGGGIVTRSVQMTVTGLPASIILTASPATLACDGARTSTVSATVRDAANTLVVDNTPVIFSVVALGTASPIQTATTNGTASTYVTPFPGAVGVTVIVTSGSVQSSIGVLCSPPPPPTVPHASSGATSTTVQAASTGGIPNTPYRIDLFASATCGPTTPGGTYIGSFTRVTDGAGVLKFTQLLSVAVPPGQFIRATATDPYNYTSAFSVCQAIAPRLCTDDTLCNGYTDAQKIALGKDPFVYCAIMRADVNGDGRINILDLATIATQYLQVIPPGSARYDQNGDGRINILDLSIVASHYQHNVSECP